MYRESLEFNMSKIFTLEEPRLTHETNVRDWMHGESLQLNVTPSKLDVQRIITVSKNHI